MSRAQAASTTAYSSSLRNSGISPVRGSALDFRALVPIYPASTHESRRTAVFSARSAAGELRIALVLEGGHALGQVGRRGGERLVGAFELERIGERALEGAVEELLGEPEGAGWARGEAGGEGVSLV